MILPDPTQLDIDARATLRNPRASREAVDAAIKRLQWSGDWEDIRLVSDARNALWSEPVPFEWLDKPDPWRVVKRFWWCFAITGWLCFGYKIGAFAYITP